MIISVNWLRELVDLGDVSAHELAKVIGARLVEVEEVIDLGKRYKGIIVVEVKECEKIPETKLNICQIDIGEKELVQVVCGAPNVRKGLVTAWIPPGATVPNTYGDAEPFVIGAKELRGQMSNGMLAGIDELGLGDDTSGIVELNNWKAKPGSLIADVLDLNDYLLDIENKSLTHRPDTFGVIGFAREVAGILGKKFETPEFLIKNEELLPVTDEKIKIDVEDRELCAAYRAIVMGAGVDLRQPTYPKGPSASATPIKNEKILLSEMKIKLVKSGMRPISKSVDISNYIMILTGQPLHFFDYDKLLEVGKGDTAEIVVRSAKNGEKMELLDGKTIEMTDGDIVICSGKTPVALAGVMGGSSTAVDENTERILIEAATFNLYSIRSTGMRYGIFSEALTRFTKGQPAELSKYVIDDAVMMLRDESKMEILSKVYESASAYEAVKLNVSVEEINKILGTSFAASEMAETLANVGFGVKIKGEKLDIAVPYWRTDIHILEDIAEEVGRLTGYDNIPMILPKRSAKQVERDSMGDFKQKLRSVLSGMGANEVLTYSFVAGVFLESVGQDPKNSYRLVNSISPELQYYRQSLLPSLIEKAGVNLADGFGKFALYEINKVSPKSTGLNDEEVPVEEDRVAMILVDENSDSVATFYDIKNKVYEVIRQMGGDVSKVEVEEIG
ncbi:phenylalanine--tRNA ligase subunit beta, partial [Candidatus Saccharibacteria bacterium]|nr:phenylalanine--tRNA ligase subunit beta [Candidatus Saccharibacteria bacterium]